MPMLRIAASDDGGPVAGRVLTGTDDDRRFAVVEIGRLSISVDGYDEEAAERCQAIAAAFHHCALELLRPPAPAQDPNETIAHNSPSGATTLPPPPGETGRELTGDAAGQALAKMLGRRTIADCGCSKHKIAAGLCDIYDQSGAPRDLDGRDHA